MFAYPPLLLGFALALGGCAAVDFKDTSPRTFVTQRHGTVLGTGEFSVATRQALVVLGIEPEDCERDLPRCLTALESHPAIGDEQRLATASELWLGHAIATSPADSKKPVPEQALGAYLQSARAAYAYLFFTPRKPEQRTFDARQAQVIEFYNYAAQRAITTFFTRLPPMTGVWPRFELAGWNWLRPDSHVTFGIGQKVPSELIPAQGLEFEGLRNEYERDGFGATFVAAAPGGAWGERVPDEPWRMPEYESLTGLLIFPGATLAEVVATRDVRVLGLDAYDEHETEINGRKVTVAANYTAPYGVWLARSGFAKQSLRSLLGSQQGLARPQVILMRPFDPDRLTVVMIHGLASSPEAWINVANALLGDDEHIRDTYQIWQVYYPTNVPVAVNTAQIRKALQATIDHVDPTGTSTATNNMVLVGHSMGGLIARLLVSDSDERLWDVVPVRADYPADKRQALHEQLRPYLAFTPMPEFNRVIFLAAPHRGSPKAQMSLARWFRSLIRLPGELLSQNAQLTKSIEEAGPLGHPTRIPNSLDNLNEADAFVVAASQLPMSPAVTFHSIVGVYKGDGVALEDSSDGVVPYRSSHLDGAESELSVPSWHSVQETREAILEMRRILRLHAEANGHGEMPAVSD